MTTVIEPEVKLTQKEQLLEWMRSHADEEQHTPQIAALTGINATTVSQHLAALARDGVITKIKLGRYILLSDPKAAPKVRVSKGKRRAPKRANGARKSVVAKQTRPFTFDKVTKLSDTEMLVKYVDSDDYFVLRAVNV